MKRWFLLITSLLIVLAACGAPEQPIAVQPSPAPQQASTAAPAQPAATNTLVQAASGMPVARGRKLRELWPQALAGKRQVTTLLYSDVLLNDDDERQLPVGTFWRVNVQDITNPQQIMKIPLAPPYERLPLYGELSPDDAYIAYLRRLGDSAAELRVVRSDGSNDHLVAAPVSSVASRNIHGFAWSPDSSQLAFIKYGEKGQEFYVYDVRTAAPPKQIAKVGGAELAGWRDNKNVLVYLVTDQQRPLQITSIDVDTTAQEALAEIPRWGTVFTYISPDNSKMRVSEYLFDFKTKQFTKIPYQGDWIWSPDGQYFIDSPRSSKGNGQLMAATSRFDRNSFNLLEPPNDSNYYDILSISPDRRYLAVCEYRDLNGASRLFRTLLYDILNDQWTPIGERPYCLQVLGWLPAQ